MSEVNNLRVLLEHCRTGALSELQNWAERCGLTAEVVRADNNKAPRGSCENGRLGITQWLTERFDLTAEDVRFYGNWALRQSCAKGHLEVAQWLTEHFGLTAAVARAPTSMRRWSCAGGT